MTCDCGQCEDCRRRLRRQWIIILIMVGIWLLVK